MLEIDRAKVEVPFRTRWWGQEYTCDPRFVEQALGDGNVLLGMQPLNTRPHYYVIRVDSSWHLDGCRICGISKECPDLVAEHLDEIYDAIEDEYGERDRIRESNEDLEPGQEPDPDCWPVLDLDCGASWFPINADKFGGC